ncbi:hypothetical protein Slin15195_G024090 [Septoria linicola]|uniref:Uncharacterized protein n=1 Tax=Septoria linicola TaxID=215465 RepID=A0A9Q9AMD4_9PEZI|nr:hypothetical protein Slin14017_G023180 [Septoria linicola]USW49090.1 hypothetical protein Slin15195_G024090 [Septoria linicola]
MAQGQIKKAKAPAAKPSNRKQMGARVIKAQKGSALKTQQFKKKHSSGLAEATEKSLATRAGHLELLKGGKREKRQELAKKAQEAAKKK